MNNFYIPSKSPDSWKEFLAEPEKQWKKGYSARSLAYCWEEAKGFPNSILKVFKQTDISLFQNIEFLLGIPEHKVELPGNGPESQNDIFVLAKSSNELISIAVEGKVSEPFSNQTVNEWLAEASENKKVRINGLAEILGLPTDKLLPIKYQLVHRTASALLEADRFCAKHALMLVHSFSQEHKWFEDYAAFASLYGKDVKPDSLVHVGNINGKELCLGWATGEEEYLHR